MAEATNEPMYGLLKSIHQLTDRFDAALSEVRQEITSVRLSMTGVQTDIHNIDGMLARHDERFDRIERREFAEPRRPIHP